MVGFFARAATREIRIDADELVEADWYSRDFLLGLDRDARPGEAPFTLPPRHFHRPPPDRGTGWRRGG